MSTSSPTNGSPEKLGQGEGSRKSSFNAFTTPPSGDKESDDDGYVTAEDEDDATAENQSLQGRARGGGEDPTIEATPPDAAPVENTSGQSGVRGLMGRMRL